MKILAFTLAILNCLSTFAQTGKLNKDTSGFKAPLYVVKLSDGTTSTTRGSLLAMIDPQHIEAMEIYTDSKSVEQYGDKAKNGVIMLTLKKEAPIATYDKVLDMYKVATKYKRLPLYIDSNLTANDGQIFLSTDKLKSVKVATEKETGMKYISIITNNVKVQPDPNAFYIRGAVTGALK